MYTCLIASLAFHEACKRSTVKDFRHMHACMYRKTVLRKACRAIDVIFMS